MSDCWNSSGAWYLSFMQSIPSVRFSPSDFILTQLVHHAFIVVLPQRRALLRTRYLASPTPIGA